MALSKSAITCALEFIVESIRENQVDITIDESRLSGTIATLVEYARELVTHLKDMANKKIGHYVVDGSSVSVLYNIDDDITPDRLCKIIKSPDYTQKYSEIDEGRYVELYTIDECKEICSDLVEDDLKHMISSSTISIYSVGDIKYSCGKIFRFMSLRNESGNRYNIPDIFIKRLLTQDEVDYIEAARTYDKYLEETIEAAKVKRGQLLESLKSVHGTLFTGKQDREEGIRKMIEYRKFDAEKLIQEYGGLLEKVESLGELIKITFAEGKVNMRYSGSYSSEEDVNVYMVNKKPITATFNKYNGWKTVFDRSCHPHVSSGGEICVGSYDSDFAAASSIGDIRYMIELLHTFLSVSGYSSSYMYLDTETLYKTWEIVGLEKIEKPRQIVRFDNIEQVTQRYSEETSDYSTESYMKWRKDKTLDPMSDGEGEEDEDDD